MQGHWSRRAVVGTMLAGFAAPATVALVNAAEEEKPVKPAPGALTTESLGALLKALGLTAKLQDKRYDFGFKAVVNEQDWELSLSAVLSQDNGSVWVMAWLDELPKSAADVPRTALLRMLSDNDRMGKGKFFAYISANRRFVLQRVVPNQQMTAASFRAVLDDLGQTVVETYPHWAVRNWSQAGGEDPGANSASEQGPASSTPSNAPATSPKPAARATQQAENESKFGTSKSRK